MERPSSRQVLWLLAAVSLLTTAYAAQIVVSPAGVPNGETRVPYKYKLTAINGNGNYVWTVVSGSLPPGLALASNGTISGVPTTNGSFAFSVQAADGQNTVGTAAIIMLVKLHEASLVGMKRAPSVPGDCCGNATSLGGSAIPTPLPASPGGYLNWNGTAWNFSTPSGGGGAISGTTGTFTGNVTAPTFTGNLSGSVTGGTISGMTGIFTGTVTAPTFSGALTGNASTATALAATPSQCTGGQFAVGITANGSANCGTPTGSGGMIWPTGGAGIASYNGSSAWGTSYSATNTIPSNFISTLNQSTTGNAATATALAAAPSQCTGGQFAVGITANGSANCSTPTGGGGNATSIGGSAIPTPLPAAPGGYLQWNGTAWSFATGTGGTGSPASPNNSIQFNNNGAFGGSSDLIWDTGALTLGSNSGNSLWGVIQAPTAANGLNLLSGGHYNSNGQMVSDRAKPVGIYLDDSTPGIEFSVGYTPGNPQLNTLASVYLSPKDGAGEFETNHLRIDTGVDKAPGMQHMRGSCTTAAAPPGVPDCTDDMQWPVAFPDNNYTVTCTAIEAIIGTVASVVAKTNVRITVGVLEMVPGATGQNIVEIDCIAMHD